MTKMTMTLRLPIVVEVHCSQSEWTFHCKAYGFMAEGKTRLEAYTNFRQGILNLIDEKMKVKK